MNAELIITKFEEAVKNVLSDYDEVHARVIEAGGIIVELFVKKGGERKWIGYITYRPDTALLTVIKNEISKQTLNEFTQTVENCAKELLHLNYPHRFNLLIESFVYKLTPTLYEAPISKLDAKYLVKVIIDTAKALGLKVVFSTYDLEKASAGLEKEKHCWMIEEAYLILANM